MASQRWLIRTVEKKILGPVSRAKIQELLEKGSLRDEDQVCAENGFWFSLREKEEVQRFIWKEQKQGFNPVSEASDRQEDEVSEFDDVTLVTGAEAQEDETSIPKELSEGLSPESDITLVQGPQAAASPAPQEKKTNEGPQGTLRPNKAPDHYRALVKNTQKANQNDRYLTWIFILIVMILVALLVNKVRLLEQILGPVASFSEAQAQDFSEAEKKSL